MIRVFIFLIATLAPAFAELVVVIDPGHGGDRVKGRTDGSQEGHGSSWNNANSPEGTLEKDLNLAYSIAIAKALEKDPRAQKLKIRPVLTRSVDKDLSALGRAAVAVENSARIFLSVHFNASPSKTAHGTLGLICSKDHPDWEYLHFVNPYHDRDLAFSNLVVKKVAAALQPFGGDPSEAKTIGDRIGDGGYLKDGVRALGYARQDPHLFQAVVMLLEVEFMDNPVVTSWLLGEKTHLAVREAVAQAVATAICQHLESDTPPSAPRKGR